MTFASPIYHTEVLGSSSKNPNRLLIEVLGPPSSGIWVNETKKVDVSPLELSSMSLRPTPNEFPTATLVVIPDLTPTVTPPGSPTVTQTANSTLTFAKTDFHLGSDYETDEDCEYGSSSLDIILDRDSDDLSLLRKEGGSPCLYFPDFSLHNSTGVLSAGCY